MEQGRGGDGETQGDYQNNPDSSVVRAAGSGPIGIILVDPDPYLYSSAKCKAKLYFFQKISMYCPKY